MKTSRMVLVLVGAALVAGLAYRDLMAQAAVKKPAGPVAVCDIKELLENYQKAKDLMNSLNDRRMKLENEEKDRIAKTDGIQAEIKELKAGSPEYEKRFSELQRLTFDREVWKKFESAVLLREHHRYTRLLYDEMRNSVAQIAKEQGIQVVLFIEHRIPETQTSPELGQVMEGRKVIFADPSVDITEQVLKRMNDDYKVAPK